MPVRHVHLHMIALGVNEMLRSALLQRTPVEVNHLEDVRTLEGPAKQQRALHLVIEGVLNCNSEEPIVVVSKKRSRLHCSPIE